MKTLTKHTAMLQAEVNAFSFTKKRLMPLNPYHFGSRCYYAWNRGFNDGRTYLRYVELLTDNDFSGFLESKEDKLAWYGPILSSLNQKYIKKQQDIKNG